MPELRTSSFLFLPPLLHSRNKSSLVLQPYWKSIKIKKKKKQQKHKQTKPHHQNNTQNCSRGKKKSRAETRQQSPPLLTPEQQWPMERTTHDAYTAKEIHMHTFKMLSSQAIQMFLHSCVLVIFCGQNATEPTSPSCCAEHLQENERHNHNSRKAKINFSCARFITKTQTTHMKEMGKVTQMKTARRKRKLYPCIGFQFGL